MTHAAHRVARSTVVFVWLAAAATHAGCVLVTDQAYIRRATPDDASTPPDRPAPPPDAPRADATGDGAPAGDAQGVCPAGQTLCGGHCADTQTDPAHCGGCDVACPSTANGEPTCVAGRCATRCREAYATCGDAGACDTFLGSRESCGACGVRCATRGANFVCQMGATGYQCVPGCAAGEMLCAGTCANTQIDPNNCGACGRACATAQACVGGACVCANAAQRFCGGRCVDVSSDPINCGACGVACGAGMCVAGACVAPPRCTLPQIDCGGVCVDPRTDARNCGTCGRACLMGETCASGRCLTPITCMAPLVACGPTCVNLSSDPMNCGACGRTCAPGHACTAGSCAPISCSTMLPVLCGRECTNTQLDPENCGACGRVCAVGQSCQSGACVSASCGLALLRCCSPTLPCLGLLTACLASDGSCTCRLGACPAL